MAEDRYSSNESFDRIFRLLNGETVSEAPNSLHPPKRSEDESLSGIAELLNGTLEGSDAINPLSAYGGIYCKTSTVVYSLTSGTATNITSLSSGMSASSGFTVTGSAINISRTGKYAVDWSLAIQGTADVEYQILGFWNTVAQTQLDSRVGIMATGVAHTVSGHGIVNVTTANTLLQLKAYTVTAGAHFTVRDGQVMIHRVDV